MDRYDEAIDYLVEHPMRLSAVWNVGGDTDGPACLFAWCSSTGDATNHRCGCLTMVKSGDGIVTVPRGSGVRGLTKAIREDDRLPSDISQIQHLRGEALRAALLPFAEWQRRLDREIRS